MYGSISRLAPDWSFFHGDQENGECVVVGTADDETIDDLKKNSTNRFFSATREKTCFRLFIYILLGSYR